MIKEMTCQFAFVSINTSNATKLVFTPNNYWCSWNKACFLKRHLVLVAFLYHMCYSIGLMKRLHVRDIERSEWVGFKALELSWDSLNFLQVWEKGHVVLRHLDQCFLAWHLCHYYINILHLYSYCGLLLV